jgi:hypothetical protein
MKKLSALLPVVLTAMLLLVGCYTTLEQRWEAFDAERRQEIGAKTKDHYLAEWGKPTNHTKTEGGEERRRGGMDMGAEGIWRRPRLAEDSDFHTGWGFEGLSPRLLAQRDMVTWNGSLLLVKRSPSVREDTKTNHRWCNS